MINISPIDNNSKNTNFKAVKVATTRTFMRDLPVNIDLYRLGREDELFIEKLPRKIDFKKMFPKIKEEWQKRWDQVYAYCLDKAELRGNTTYVAVHDNKICGIMTYHNDIPPLYLDGVCTIPVEPDKKVPFCGQTLMYQLFRDAKHFKSKGIVLDGVTDGPFNVIKLYERLGFRKDFSDRADGYVPMSCTIQKMYEQLEKFKKFIDYTPIETNEEERTDMMQFIV